MKSKRHGIGLVEVLIVASITSLVMLGINQLLGALGRSTNRMKQSVDMASLQQMLVRDISCDNTLPVVPPPGGCSPTNNLVLKGFNNTAITGPLETSGVMTGAGRWGDWYLKAVCDIPGETLTVRVAKPGPGGFALDPLTKQPLDFNNPTLNPIFGPLTGPRPSVSFCRNKFTPVTNQCPPGQAVSKVEFDGQNVECQVVKPVFFSEICYCVQMICYLSPGYSYGNVACARFGTWTPQAMCGGNDDDMRMLMYHCP